MTLNRERIELPALLLTLVALLVSGLVPDDRTTWWLEIAPILIILPILLVTGRRLPMTMLVCRLLFLHGLS